MGKIVGRALMIFEGHRGFSQRDYIFIQSQQMNNGPKLPISLKNDYLPSAAQLHNKIHTLTPPIPFAAKGANNFKLIIFIISQAVMFKNEALLKEEEDKMIDESEQPTLRRDRFLVSKQNLVRKWSGEITDAYLIHRKLGEGSFGTVYLVTHKQLKVQRALKCISKVNRSSSNPAEELVLLKKLDHPNIIKIYEYYQSKEKWYIVTEYFDGCQLFDEIVALGAFTQQLAVKIIVQILKALAYIHSNKIAHRDIKAENILVKKNGDEYVVKVIDWGLGALTYGEDLYRRCGTPEYCAPEVLEGCYYVGCDMWSLGVLVYIMLSGRMPFKGSNLKETVEMVKKGAVTFKSYIWSTVSQEAKDFILKLLEKDCMKRLPASQCFDDPWIRSNLSPVAVPTSLKETLQRLKEFRVENRLHIVVMNYIMNFIEAPSQIDRLKQQFQLLDTNKDGSISYDELLFAYKQIYGIEAYIITENVFKNVDLDGSGGITFSEYITFASVITHDFNKAQLKEAFKLFDTDSDGLIDKKELNSLICYERGGNKSPEFDEMLNEIDLNNDGKIDLEEFIQHVNRAASKIRTKSSLKSQSKVQEEQQQLDRTVQLSPQQMAN